MAQQAPQNQPVTLYTWNTQGNFTQGPKGEVVQQMLGVQTPALTFVQEGGVNLAGDYQGYKAVAGFAVGAFNERCTNYILYNDAWGRLEPVLLVDGLGSALIGGGQAGRTPAAVALDRTLFVSWHSLAAPNNLDTSAVFQAFQLAAIYKQYDQIFVGGDFNASPDDVEKILVRIPNDRNEVNFSATIVRCGQPTQKTYQKEIDFFVLFAKAPVQLQGVLVNVVPSDHEAVRTDLLLTF